MLAKGSLIIVIRLQLVTVTITPYGYDVEQKVKVHKPNITLINILAKYYTKRRSLPLSFILKLWLISIKIFEFAYVRKESNFYRL